MPWTTGKETMGLEPAAGARFAYAEKAVKASTDKVVEDLNSAAERTIGCRPIGPMKNCEFGSHASCSRSIWLTTIPQVFPVPLDQFMEYGCVHTEFFCSPRKKLA
jgi:hypothetical protein